MLHQYLSPAARQALGRLLPEPMNRTTPSVIAPETGRKGRQQPNRDAQAARTRANLLSAARALFVARGYHATGVRDITALANVTPGALIHHFGDKETLFLAVFDEVEREMLAGANKAANHDREHTLDGLCKGVRYFLDAAAQPTFQRIALIEAPAVLGWERWRALEEKLSLGNLRELLHEFMEAGVIRRANEIYLANLIFASIIEAGLLVATADDPSAVSAQVSDMLVGLLGGLQHGTSGPDA